jgi:hypothetical protein
LYHFFATFYFFYFFSFLSFLGAYYSFGALFKSYFSFLSLFIVTFAVVATLVANSKAPPAKVTLQALHFQIPQATLLTLDLPQAGQMYLALCCN